MSRLLASAALRRVLMGLIVVGGVALTLLVWNYLREQQRERIRADFLSRARTQSTVALQRIRSYEEMIYSLRDSFLSQSEVTRAEFAVMARSLLGRHPGVQGLEWVEIVPHAARRAWEEEISRDLGRPLEIWHPTPDSKRRAPDADEYWVIKFVEPQAGNEVVLGYDIRSAPTAATVTAARREREFKVSPVLPLFQSRSRPDEQGVIFMLPCWYARPADAPVAGFVQGVFKVQTMLAQSHRLTTSESLDIFYLDNNEGAAPRLLYANLGGAEPLRDGGAVALPSLDDPADYRVPIEIGGRTWHLVIRPNAAWAAKGITREPELVLLAGLTITALLALGMHSLLEQTRRVELEVKERTRQLRVSESRLQDIVDHSPAAIFVKDLDGKYLLCNHTFAALSHHRTADIIGRTAEELYPPEDAAAYRANDLLVLKAGKAMEFEEITTKLGQRRVGIVHKFPLLDDDGRPYALCGVITDITDRKAAEDEKLLIERRMLESQKLESLGVLAGGIAHDFNNILTAILGNASLAGLELGEGHPVTPPLRQIEMAARRAGDLCAQMLAYAGKAAFLTAPVDLSQLVRDTAGLLEVSVGKRVRLELQTAADLPAVNGDATQLRQIVMNLVINAADALGARPDGRVVISTFRRDCMSDFFAGAVQNPSLPGGVYVGLEVTDNGTGMPPEVLARIFEPFFTTKFSGRGLGLAAVMGIVNTHNGALFVTSTPGTGSTFRLFFPITSEPAVPSNPPFEPVAKKLSGTVLVVDDETAVRRVAVRALEVIGLTVHEAPNGQAALEIYRRSAETIDLVLLDLMMPGLTGEETLEQIRALNPDARVIIMSGFSERETMQRCATLGVSGYLAKPFEISELTQRLQAELG